MSLDLVRAIPLTANITQVISAGAGMYCGAAIRELSGGAMVIRLWDNPSAASGTIIDIISLAANGVSSFMFQGAALWFSTGLYLEKVSGTNFEGSVRIG